MDNIKSFLESPLFNTSFKTRMHYIELALVALVIILTGVRISQKPSFLPVTRSDTMAIVMGVKTIVVIAYQLLTSHVGSLKRWRNTKAYLVLNCLEVIFWLAVVVLTGMGMQRYCKGAYCGISVVIILLAVVMAVCSLWTAVTTRKLRREERFGVQSVLPVHQTSMGEGTTTKPAATYTTHRI
ncbi:hypothetical protein E4T47_09305 [Aureobasidium subglaciale]|nr:hypothetical protein E4T47_09305 [Aureobasidium subglaciale]